MLKWFTANHTNFLFSLMGKFKKICTMLLGKLGKHKKHTFELSNP
ncbi:hypothetical protein N473_18745 [Pseudoalteromonas luteoviolacea CPMOR-1]|uniref:Uncharacterized protein n=1 Tax=Pseudoalteromonas luteoviolacea CPMOR-1 TaxID=1365248 RepID=A0A162C5V1_9GAMM|nr:hypothetical protein N473_18745 [Pseudoalteromonas luteoviolacea CPMOR-1]